MSVTIIWFFPDIYPQWEKRVISGISHVNIDESTYLTLHELEKYLLDQMCRKCAEGIKLQCSREYWDDDENPRATQLYKLTEEQRKNLPNNNLEPERYLARFGNLVSLSAAKRNKFFKAKRIRDDLMFNKSIETDKIISYKAKSIIKELEAMEIKWTKSQRMKWKKKIADNLCKKRRRSDYVDEILKKCKEHNGPITNICELNVLMKNTPKENVLKKFLRQEVLFLKYLHPSDARERAHLFKVNELSVKQFVENLAILLESDPETISTDDFFVLPSQQEILERILLKKRNIVETEKQKNVFN